MRIKFTKCQQCPNAIYRKLDNCDIEENAIYVGLNYRRQTKMKPTEDYYLNGTLWSMRFSKNDVTIFPDGIMAMNENLMNKILLALEQLGYERATP